MFKLCHREGEKGREREKKVRKRDRFQGNLQKKGKGESTLIRKMLSKFELRGGEFLKERREGGKKGKGIGLDEKKGKGRGK